MFDGKHENLCLYIYICCIYMLYIYNKFFFVFIYKI